MVWIVVGIVYGLAFGMYRLYVLNKLKTVNEQLIEMTRQRNYYRSSMNEQLIEIQTMRTELMLTTAKLNTLLDITDIIL